VGAMDYDHNLTPINGGGFLEVNSGYPEHRRKRRKISDIGSTVNIDAYRNTKKNNPILKDFLKLPHEIIKYEVLSWLIEWEVLIFRFVSKLMNEHGIENLKSRDDFFICAHPKNNPERRISFCNMFKVKLDISLPDFENFPFKEFKNLKVLKVGGWLKNDKFDLSYVGKEIEQLKLFNLVINKKNMEFIKSCKNLENFFVWGCKLSSEVDLGSLENLNDLRIDCVQNNFKLKGVGKNCKNIIIRNCQQYKVADISCLNRLEKIERIHLGYINVDNLYFENFKQLISIYLHGPKNYTVDFIRFIFLNKLKCMTLYYVNVNNIDYIKELKSIKKLQLLDCYSVNVKKLFENLSPNIEEIVLCFCQNYDDSLEDDRDGYIDFSSKVMPYLHKFKKLKKLGLGQFENISRRDIENLKKRGIEVCLSTCYNNPGMEERNKYVD
jgi:hypothetical protein